MHLQLVVAQVDGDVRVVEEVVGEVLLDRVALVAETDHEVVDPEVRVELHDVPEDRASAELHHRLRSNDRLFAETRAESAGQDDSFQARMIADGRGATR